MIILNGILNTVFFPTKPPTEAEPKLSPALRQKDHRGYNSGQAFGGGAGGGGGGRLPICFSLGGLSPGSAVCRTPAFLRKANSQSAPPSPLQLTNGSRARAAGSARRGGKRRAGESLAVCVPIPPGRGRANSSAMSYNLCVWVQLRSLQDIRYS